MIGSWLLEMLAVLSCLLCSHACCAHMLAVLSCLLCSHACCADACCADACCALTAGSSPSQIHLNEGCCYTSHWLSLCLPLTDSSPSHTGLLQGATSLSTLALSLPHSLSRTHWLALSHSLAHSLTLSRTPFLSHRFSHSLTVLSQNPCLTYVVRPAGGHLNEHAEMEAGVPESRRQE
jgi:hypothetical protein